MRYTAIWAKTDFQMKGSKQESQSRLISWWDGVRHFSILITMAGMIYLKRTDMCIPSWMRFQGRHGIESPCCCFAVRIMVRLKTSLQLSRIFLTHRVAERPS